MSYLVLSRKYRPQRFQEVVAQDHVTRTLKHALEADRLAHAILFTGPRGTGKTTVARILAKAVNCDSGPTATPCNQCQSCNEITAGSSADVYEIDGASNNSVDQVRELRDNAVYKPAYSRSKIYIIDEVHMLSVSAFNALLKILEEPPDHVLFFFATTEPRKIPITILSRCQRHDLRRIASAAIVDQMAALCAKEKVEVPEATLRLIAKEADGSMRDALSLLDQVIVLGGDKIDHHEVVELLGVVDHTTTEAMADDLIAGRSQALLACIDEIYAHGQDIYGAFADLTAQIRRLLVIKLVPEPEKILDISEAERAELQAKVETVSAPWLQTLFEQLTQAEPAVRLAKHPRLTLEMVMLKLAQAKPVLPIDTLIDKIDCLRQSVADALSAVAATDSDDMSVSVSPATPDAAPAQSPVQAPTAAAQSARGDEENAAAPFSHEPGNLTATWGEIKTRVAEAKPSLAASLKNVAIAQTGPRELTLEIKGSDFSRARVASKTSLALIAKAANIVLGGQWHLKLNRKTSPSPEHKAQAQRKKSAASGHPLVNEALTIFEGEVIDVITQEEKR
jgi:DNA polymerase-3 subunit gamma/tau